MRRVPAVTEIAMTFVLVVGAALLVQTLWILTTKDHGFEADRLLTVRVSPGTPRDLDRTDLRAQSRYSRLFFSDLQRPPRSDTGRGRRRAPSHARRSREPVAAGPNITLDGRGHPAGESSTPYRVRDARPTFEPCAFP